MARLSVRLWKDQKGQDTLEYALLLLLIALTLVASIRSLSESIDGLFQGITNSVSAATTSGSSGSQGGSGGNGN
jgi:Flp pilus assembly pilin Flp